MWRFLLILTGVFVLTACGAAPVNVGELGSTPISAPESQWTLHFSQSGGIAGLRLKMDVGSDGKAVVTDERTGKTANIQLSSAQLSELRQLADKSVFQPVKPTSTCADCFGYTLEIDTGSGTPFTAQLDDMNLDASGLGPLVEFLRGLMQEALKS
jgi:hypothetical protein